ncbi:hypothetical protein MUP46_01160 [Patescibacteria group bacterium]|nr:hypothetical protein [Patescibacteria group bacterium]
MVKSALLRSQKYSAKADPDAARIRIANYAAFMKSNQADPVNDIAAPQQLVRDALNEEGIAPIFTIPYMAVGLKIWKLQKNYTGDTLNNELQLQLGLFEDRGCTQSVLTAVALKFGVTYPSP